MSLDPSVNLIPPPADGRELAVSGGLSGLSIGSTFLAMAQSFPANGAVAAMGIFVSGAIQVARMWTDKRIERLVSDLNHAHAAQLAADAREREARAEAAAQRDADRRRIAELVAQLKESTDARERMMAALLQHAGDVPADASKAVAAAAHAACPFPGPDGAARCQGEPQPVPLGGASHDKAAVTDRPELDPDA